MFIKKNVDKWNEYQREETNDPDETAERFTTLVDDLSYSKTFYPHSQVTKWINAIAAGIYQKIYRNKRRKFSKLFVFWKYELPLLFRKYHRMLLFVFLLNLTFTLMGAWGSSANEGFMRSALGAGYVKMTNDNIKNHNPFGVYQQSANNPFTDFVEIAINNISVAFLMAIGGLTLCIWTLFSVWKNCLMLGAFQYIFFKHNLGMQSVLVIWVHGTLEISAFIIASLAGFIIAHSILFPETYSRWQSFRRGIKDALKIMVVLVPIFILAAFFESYITHLMSNTYDNANKQHGMPEWISITILASSLAFMTWYFVIHPIRLHKRGIFINSDGAVRSSSAFDELS